MLYFHMVSSQATSSTKIQQKLDCSSNTLKTRCEVPPSHAAGSAVIIGTTREHLLILVDNHHGFIPHPRGGGGLVLLSQKTGPSRRFDH